MVTAVILVGVNRPRSQFEMLKALLCGCAFSSRVCPLRTGIHHTRTMTAAGCSSELYIPAFLAVSPQSSVQTAIEVQILPYKFAHAHRAVGARASSVSSAGGQNDRRQKTTNEYYINTYGSASNHS